ncbi:Transposase IS66 family protein [Bradyrhizobium sp. Ghvi]|nr:Transposase IS66 family protein [Bradyrhizobium sp. Ghvi]
MAAERVHADDTTAPVLAKAKTDTGRCWVYVRDDRPFGAGTVLLERVQVIRAMWPSLVWFRSEKPIAPSCLNLRPIFGLQLPLDQVAFILFTLSNKNVIA